MMNFTVRCCTIFTAALSFSVGSYAQSPTPSCNPAWPLNDENADGYADEYVSPLARIHSSTIDCSAHNIESGVDIVDSNVHTFVAIKPSAKIIRADLSMFSTIGHGAKVIDSEITSDVSVGSSTVIASNSYVRDDVAIGKNSRVLSSRIAESTIGDRVVITKDSDITTANIENNVRITGADVYGSKFSDLGNIIRSGTRIEIGSILLGPFDIGANSDIGRNVQLQNSSFGNNFKIASESSVSFAASIASDVSIGQRVRIARFAVVDNDVRVGDDASLGALIKIGESAKIGADTRIGNSISIGSNTSIGAQSRIHDLVFIGDEVVIGRNTTIELSARIEDGALVQAGSTVPSEFVVESDTVFPSDYADIAN